METHRKHLLDRFQEHLNDNFEAYCDSHGIDKTDNGLLTFLIDQDLISAAHIQRYTVLKEFERLHSEKTYHKTHAVHVLAHRFSLSERTVWSILRQLRKTRPRRADER